MAFTIAQLQAFSNTKPELRYVTEEIIDYLQANPGGDVTIPATSYDNNTDAEAALGAGVLYKSTTLINGSPIILITV